jgi:hypothetical protein
VKIEFNLLAQPTTPGIASRTNDCGGGGCVWIKPVPQPASLEGKLPAELTTRWKVQVLDPHTNGWGLSGAVLFRKGTPLNQLCVMSGWHDTVVKLVWLIVQTCRMIECRPGLNPENTNKSLQLFELKREHLPQLFKLPQIPFKLPQIANRW